MEKEIIILEEPKIPTKWDYDQSVKKIKVLVYQWKNLTAEVFNELYIARAILSKTGSHKSSWDDYCQEIGIERRTANRWIDRFINPLLGQMTQETPELPKGKYDIIYALTI